MRAQLRALVLGALVGVLCLTQAQPVLAAQVDACGALQTLTRPNAPQQEGAGSATIDGKVYRLSSALSTNNTNMIGAGVAVGIRVCLTGELVPGTSDLVNNYRLVPSAGASKTSLPSTSTTSGDMTFTFVLVSVTAGVILASQLKVRRARSATQ